MKKSTLALAVMGLVSSGVSLAAPVGGTSNSAGVAVGASNHSQFGGGNSGVALNGAGSYIDLAKGPINGSNNAIADHGNGAIMTPADAGMFPLPIDIAQVWSANDSSTGANFAINSVRQITRLDFAPQFGGLVIGQVADASGTPLAVGSGVYFGEWAPRAAGTPPANSTDLNMASNERTVWYVGDNAVTSTPGMVDVTYGVIGIQQTGVGSNLPGAHKLYTGTLTANYGSGNNSLTGSITRGSDSVNFTSANVAIDTSGGFSGTGISGKFYNGAEALAGIYTGGASVADHVAFGGSKTGGTITP
ncbi:MAG: hypothetical protein ACTHXN_00165 [Oceanisphaera sp.]